MQEDQRRKEEEAETEQRVEEGRRARQAEAQQRAEHQRAFAAAKDADSVGAVDEFIASHPGSHLAEKAKALRTTLIEREQAHAAAMVSNDLAVLRAFLDRYPAGKPADEARSRLRKLEPRRSWEPSRRAMLIGGGALGIGTMAAGNNHHPQPRPIDSHVQGAHRIR